MIRNALFLCVVCALVFVFYLPSYVRMQDLNEKNAAYEKKIRSLEVENIRLDEERRRLTEDPVYFEKVAREKMGIIRNDEVLYKIVGPGQKSAAGTQAAVTAKKEPVAAVIKPKAATPKAAVKSTKTSKSTTTTKTTAKAAAAQTTTKAQAKSTAASAKSTSSAAVKSTSSGTKKTVTTTKKSTKAVTSKVTTNSVKE